MSEPISVARPSWRPERPAGIDPDMKRMGLVAAALGGGLAVLIGGWSLLSRPGHGVPVIEAAAGPVRIKPADPGGMKVTGAEDGMAAGAGQAERLAPAAEQPQIDALKAQLRAAKRQLARAAAAKAEAAAHLAAAASSPTHTALVAAPAPVHQASAIAMRPAEPAPPPPVPVARPGNEVQLAAFSDQRAASAGWDKLVQKVPELLGGRRPDITHAELAGHGVWRLRVGGFETAADSIGFCARMRAKGAACSIAAF